MFWPCVTRKALPKNYYLLQCKRWIKTEGVHTSYLIANHLKRCDFCLCVWVWVCRSECVPNKNLMCIRVVCMCLLLLNAYSFIIIKNNFILELLHTPHLCKKRLYSNFLWSRHSRPLKPNFFLFFIFISFIFIHTKWSLYNEYDLKKLLVDYSILYANNILSSWWWWWWSSPSSS